MAEFFFGELKQYIGFDERVEAALRECAPVVEPHFPDIVESFYQALWANPRTRAVFEDEEQVQRLKRMLSIWLREAFFGPWDDAYFGRRVRIGHVHVKVGLLPHFMGGAMNVIRRHTVGVLFEADSLALGHVEAVERLFDLELTMMTQTYWDHMMRLKLEVPLALATGLAHEIRNPLNAIALNLTLLDRKLKTLGEDESRHIVEAAQDEVRRITLLTTELMDFAKPLEIHPRWEDAERMLSELEKIHSPQFESSGVTLNVELRGDPRIWVDTDRLRQALVNLLTNAQEAVATHEPSGAVSLRIENEASATTIEVSDDGPGIAPDLAYKVFDLFFTAKASGTGLGLPIVKKIVEAHGGTIELESHPRGGALFRIRLPRPSERPDE